MATETAPPTAGDTAPRRRRRLLRRVMGAIEQRQRVQDLGFGLLVSALAMAWPASAPYTGGGEAARRLSVADEELTQGLLYPLGSGLVGTVDGMDGDSAIRLIAALCLGGAFTLTLAFLRGLGFRRSASLPASVTAFAAPFSWIGATSPIDYAPGMFGASLLLWSLFRQPQDTQRGYQWRAIVCFGVAFMLHMELILLVPATAWAVARHPEYRREAQIAAFSVVAVLMMSIAIGLAGPSESLRVDHLVTRALAGADGPSPAAWLGWLVAAPIGFGAGLFGIYQLLIAQRSAEAKRAPVWMVARKGRHHATIVAGSPELAPISPYLIPAGALGLADWLNRQGSASREARVGTAVALAQLGVTAAVILTR